MRILKGTVCKVNFFEKRKIIKMLKKESFHYLSSNNLRHLVVTAKNNEQQNIFIFKNKVIFEKLSINTYADSIVRNHSVYVKDIEIPVMNNLTEDDFDLHEFFEQVKKIMNS